MGLDKAVAGQDIGRKVMHDEIRGTVFATDGADCSAVIDDLGTEWHDGALLRLERDVDHAGLRYRGILAWPGLVTTLFVS